MAEARKAEGVSGSRVFAAKLRGGPVAEIGAHPLQDLLGPRLSLDCQYGFDLEHQDRAVGPASANRK